MDYIILDIETISNPAMERFLPIVSDDIIVPKKYKKEESIIEYVKEKKEENAIKRAELKNKMALDIDFCTIKCIGFSTDINSPENEIYLCNTEADELEAIERFCDAARDKRIIGYNLINFDLPIISRRAMVLKSLLFHPIDISKYNYTILDLMYKLYFNGYVSNLENKKPFSRGLKKVCEIFGIENTLKDVDGSMISKMTDLEIKTYNNNDINLTKELFRKMNGYYF